MGLLYGSDSSVMSARIHNLSDSKIWQSCHALLFFQFQLMKHYKQMGSFENVRKLFAPVNLHIQVGLILELQN